MSSREQRIAANEANFREVNERIAGNDAGESDSLEIICECGNPDCFERITVSRADYEHARSDPTFFLAKPGHLEPDGKEVVAERPEYRLLRKTGDAAAVAEERDPRS